MPRYKLTDDARKDLCEIRNYSVKQFGLIVTREYLHGMRICLQRLAENRQMGSDNIAELGILGLWCFSYISHTIYYLFAPYGITVDQRRLPNILRGR